MFTSQLVDMHLLEGPDLGHSMIYYDEKLVKKRWKKKKKKKKAQCPAKFEPLTLRSRGECSATVVHPRPIDHKELQPGGHGSDVL